MKEDYEERRRNGGLTHDQFETLKSKLREELSKDFVSWDEVYQRVGKSVLTKGLYLLGTSFIAAAAWLHGAGKIVPGSE